MSNALLADNPAHTPLTIEQYEQLVRLCQGLDAQALWWVAGYVAASARTSARTNLLLPATSSAGVASRLTVVFGTQTGNAERLAKNIVDGAQMKGVATRLLRADQYSLKELRNEQALCIVMSTQGDGDPPDDSRAFIDALFSARAPRLPNLHYAVLGLGDSSYPKFCSIAKALDARLAELGAQRYSDVGMADVDIDQVATPWITRALAQISSTLSSAAAPIALASVINLKPLASRAATPQGVLARVVQNLRITSKASSKDVRHLELELQGDGIRYTPGDALAIQAKNPAATVANLLQTQRWSAQTVINCAGKSLPLLEWLSAEREITKLTPAIVLAHAQRAQSEELHGLLKPENAQRLREYLARSQLIDLLQEFPAPWDAAELVQTLRPLSKRLYSIASSQSVVGDEVHLTVAHVRYERHGAARFGAASHFLACAAEGDQWTVQIEINERFRLPKDPRRNIIMIGPGTGVAPFRAFLQERSASTATGKNWLFFGNPHFTSDFLYQLEWQAALKKGALHRLDLAFSRDTTQKSYVQHRLLDRAADVFTWLEEGAHIYVCGDASRMGKDVDRALQKILTDALRGRDDQAQEYLHKLQREQRYQRDVY
jgi:sulfite reductase (NADPH) flavoprotein alpha-component